MLYIFLEEFTRSEHYNYFENKWLHTENNLIIIGETNHIFWRNERFEMLLKKKLIQSHHITLPVNICILLKVNKAKLKQKIISTNFPNSVSHFSDK